MEITKKRIKDILKKDGYSILSIEDGINLYYVDVKLKNDIVCFDCSGEIKQILYSFTVYKDFIGLYINKRVTGENSPKIKKEGSR